MLWDPFLIYFFLDKVVVGPVNSALCLLHSESMCMNSIVTVHMRRKKRKKKKRGNVKLIILTRNKSNSSGHIVMLILFSGSYSLSPQPNLKQKFVNFQK